MKKLLFIVNHLLLILISRAQTVQLTLTDTSHQIINKYIYGHFAEDLGRCIYDGFWVDSNLNVSKQDVFV